MPLRIQAARMIPVVRLSLFARSTDPLQVPGAGTLPTFSSVSCRGLYGEIYW